MRMETEGCMEIHQLGLWKRLSRARSDTEKKLRRKTSEKSNGLCKLPKKTKGRVRKFCQSIC